MKSHLPGHILGVLAFIGYFGILVGGAVLGAYLYPGEWLAEVAGAVLGFAAANLALFGFIEIWQRRGTS